MSRSSYVIEQVKRDLEMYELKSFDFSGRESSDSARSLADAVPQLLDIIEQLEEEIEHLQEIVDSFHDNTR